MKIAFCGLDLPEGKFKYNDPIVIALEEKFQPKKTVPYFVEFLKGDFEKAEAIVIAKAQMLDLLILDMEKLESRATRSEDAAEKSAIEKGLRHMENESPLCDLALSEAELEALKLLAPLSLKPTLVIESVPDDLSTLIHQIMEKAGVSFFYTAGKPEVHSWFIRKGSDIVTCAGKIHTDLARGFIKADILNFRDIDKVHSMQDAKTKNLSKLVDRDYIIEEGDIIEIRFSVSKG
ncbi:MAG: hypothetical protein A2X49_00310 [Lentisphaerae bacterium GWF2_52_8]|nr:MAG: hypothetical protein A2X49_00310 [Lentisphaerae bacterium GWF2_52_8]